MKVLKCKSCNHQNIMSSPFLVFCAKCNTKLENNFVDWNKKANNSCSFEMYVDTIGVDFIAPKPIIKALNKKMRLFIAAISIQVLLFGSILFIENSEFENFQKTTTKEYINEIKWHNTIIGNELNLILPFKLINNETLLAPHITNNLEHLKSLRAETTCQSFSISIEEIKVNEGFYINESEFFSIEDAYYLNGTQQVNSVENNMRLKIKNYDTYLTHGFFTYADKNYIYDNYTLINHHKVYKIIMSYVQNDPLISDMADVVNQSILNNAIIKS